MFKSNLTSKTHLISTVLQIPKHQHPFSKSFQSNQIGRENKNKTKMTQLNNNKTETTTIIINSNTLYSNSVAKEKAFKSLIPQFNNNKSTKIEMY